VITEILLVVAIVLAIWQRGRWVITEKAAVALGVELKLLNRKVRDLAAEMATAPPMTSAAEQIGRARDWARDLESACRKAETYYHLKYNPEFGGKQHGTGTRQDL
jgi:hypothetical protein